MMPCASMGTMCRRTSQCSRWVPVPPSSARHPRLIGNPLARGSSQTYDEGHDDVSATP